MSIVQPKLTVVTIAATNKRLFQNADGTALKTLAVRVKLKAHTDNTADVWLQFAVGADLPEPGGFTAPAAGTADTAISIPKGTAAAPVWLEFALSAREVENGYYYDLAQWFVNGTADDLLDVIYEPPYALNII